MGFISKSYLTTQLTNFASRISAVFAVKTSPEIFNATIQGNVALNADDLVSSTNSAKPAIKIQWKETIGDTDNHPAVFIADIPANNSFIKTSVYAEVDTDSAFHIVQQNNMDRRKTDVSINVSEFKITYGISGTYKTIFSTNEGTISSTTMRPLANNTYTLGNGTYRWKQLYANTATISTSDRTLKDNIKELDDKWIKFFMRLQPVSFTFKDGESGRTHIGFVSQDVEEAMFECDLKALDFAGFCKDQLTREVEIEEEVLIPATDEEAEHIEKRIMKKEELVFDEYGEPVYIYALRYEEFIALNTMVCQKLMSELKSLDNRLKEVEERIK